MILEAISFLFAYIAFKQVVDVHKAKTRKIRSQKKSSEVRLGHISEQLAPFLKDFPEDPSSAQFLGRPIDYICFTDGGITFVEVKSGKSRLSKKQRKIRDQIEDGKVEFKTYRVDGK